MAESSTHNEECSPDCLFCRLPSDIQGVIVQCLGPTNPKTLSTFLLVSKCWRERLSKYCQELTLNSIEDLFACQLTPNLRRLTLNNLDIGFEENLIQLAEHLPQLYYIDISNTHLDSDKVAGALSHRTNLYVYTTHSGFMCAVRDGRDLDPYWERGQASFNLVNNQSNGLARTALCLAAWNGRRKAVSSLLAHGAPVDDTEDRLGYTPFLLAVDQGHVETARILLQHGASIHTETNNGYLAMTIAAFRGSVELAQLLLEYGVNINRAPRISPVRTPFVQACSSGHPEFIRFLLRSGATTEHADEGGLYACRNGHLSTLILLEERMGGLPPKAPKLKSYLLRACEGGHLDIVQHLLDINAPLDSTALREACLHSRCEIIRLLLERARAMKENANAMLLLACQRGKLATARVLLEQGASVEARDPKGDTALTLAIGNGEHDLVLLLLSHGAAPDRPGAAGTPLWLACEGGHHEIVAELLSQGVEVGRSRGLSLLCVAGSVKVIDVLVDRGVAALNEPLADGHTALYHAMRMGKEKAVQALQEKGAVEYLLRDE